MTKEKKSLIPNDIFSDYKAITKASDLINQGVDRDQIEFFTIGGSRRSFAKEIDSIETIISNDPNPQEIIRININREGLYDMLPEGLFHSLQSGKEILDEDIMIHDIENKRKQELNARLFFAPYENELYHLKLKLEDYERRIDMQTTFTESSELLISSWEELKILNPRQRNIWMHFIPEIQFHKNDLGYIQSLLTQLLNIPIKVTRKLRNRQITWAELGMTPYAIGDCQLGIDSITNYEYELSEEYIEVKIGPTFPNKLMRYLPNQRDQKIATTTLDYLLPAIYPVEIIYDLLDENKYTYLLDEDQEVSSILGHTSYL